MSGSGSAHSRQAVAALALTAALAAPACAWRAKPDGDPYLLARSLAERLSSKASGTSAAATGSLWDQSSPRAGLVADNRAYRSGDIVKVLIAEQTEGKHASQTDTRKEAEGAYKVPTLFGLEQEMNGRVTPGFNMSDLLSYSREKTFKGDGSTSRTNEMSAVVSCRVVTVLPNGDLVLAGSKDVTVNREMQSLWLAGVARPIDLSSGNAVMSTSLSDLEMYLGGRGDVNDVNRQGWLARFLDRVMPF